DVLQDAAAARVGKEDVIEQGYEWRALASSEHVCRPEVGDNGHMQARGDGLGFAGLPGTCKAAARIRRGTGLVIKRLAVTADEIKLMALCGGRDGFSVFEAEPPVEARQFGSRGDRSVHGREHGAPQRCG